MIQNNNLQNTTFTLQQYKKTPVVAEKGHMEPNM